LQEQLPGVRRAADQAEQQLKEALSRITSQRNRELDELYQKRGSLESEVGYLLRFHKAAATFSELHKTAGRLAAEIRELELRIETKRRTQLHRRSLAEEMRHVIEERKPEASKRLLPAPADAEHTVLQVHSPLND
jgi:chaperonin cofactor prefoldin